MPLDGRIRDPSLVSTIADEGLSDRIAAEILVETLRTFFLAATNFASQRMRARIPALLWSPDAATSKVRILRAGDWKPATMGQTPEIVVRNQGITISAVQHAHQAEGFEDRVDDPTLLQHQIMGRVTIWAISPVYEEAEDIAWEIGLFLAAFAQPLCLEYGFDNVQPAGVGAPAHIREREGYWGAPVIVAHQWMQFQELIEQKPRLAEIIARTSADGSP